MGVIMTSDQIRKKYLEFFKSRGHVIVPSASLVPENDPTTLFTGSGMQPMLQYFLGTPHPLGTRITDSQKSFRAGDIEEIGDNRHTTFFEMLGNWSFGDYFKTEQISWMFEFLTTEIGIDPKKLYVTAFIGDEDNNIPKDTVSVEIWQKLFNEKGIEAKVVEIGSEADGFRDGMRGGQIFYYNAKKNWWSRSGVPENMPVGEPGGPDSEMFLDFGLNPQSSGGHANIGDDLKWGAHCHPNCDCGRFMEIGNNVFMQYVKNQDGSFALLPKQNVDFGGGLERILAAALNEPDVYKAVDIFRLIITFLESNTGKKYEESDEVTKAMRIVAEHMRAAVMLIADGVIPTNSDQGYFVRRLIRRAIRYADKLGMHQSGLSTLSRPIAQAYKEVYPEVLEQVEKITSVLADEESRFRSTLERGLKEFNKLQTKSLSGTDIAMLYQTYGFPFELIVEIATEQGINIDEGGFKDEMKKHRDLSRSGSEQKFKGGLADTSEKTTRLHTAHHLLLRALQLVLGPEVHQRGSNITQERLRIDFNYGAKMTDDQKQEVERIVNEKIQEGIMVVRTEMALEEAEKLGAEHEFGAKYPERVSVYSVGPLDNAFSIEFCGGPHVTNTSELAGKFKIQKEEAVAAGIRRIKAVLT